LSTIFQAEMREKSWHLDPTKLTSAIKVAVFLFSMKMFEVLHLHMVVNTFLNIRNMEPLNLDACFAVWHFFLSEFAVYVKSVDVP
jgi:hypothetical protein